VTHENNTKINGVHFTEFSLIELRDIFYKKGDIGALLKSYSESLIYQDDMEEIETKKEED
jgi:hypothetical protein